MSNMVNVFMDSPKMTIAISIPEENFHPIIDFFWENMPQEFRISDDAWCMCPKCSGNVF